MGIEDSEPSTSKPTLDRGVGRGRFRTVNRWRDDEPPAAAEAEQVAPPRESSHCSSQEELGPVERHLQELLNYNFKKNNGAIDNQTIREILNNVTLQDLSKYSGLCKKAETAEEQRHADLVPQEDSATLQQDVHEIKNEPKESAASKDVGQTVETKKSTPGPNEPEEAPRMTARPNFPGDPEKTIIGPAVVQSITEMEEK